MPYKNPKKQKEYQRRWHREHQRKIRAQAHILPEEVASYVGGSVLPKLIAESVSIHIGGAITPKAEATLPKLLEAKAR